MLQRRCVIVPKEMKNEFRIQAALRESKQDSCQFLGELSADYEHNGEHYCLMHLPYEAKKRLKLLSAAEQTLNEQILNGEKNLTLFHFKD